MAHSAIISGSFDPITFGHLDIIHRASTMFDVLYIAVCVNEGKTPLFTIEQRIAQVTQCVGNIQNVRVIEVEGLLSNYTTKHGITCIVRGIRNASDFQYEDTMASINKDLGDIDTVLLFSNPILRHVSSSMVKSIVSNNGLVDRYVPLSIDSALKSRLLNKKLLCVVGTSGSGKSSLLELMYLHTVQTNPSNMAFINLDIVANAIYDSSEPYAENAKRLLAEYFGNGIFLNGSINRKALAEIVFNDIEALSVLNEIMATPIRHRINEIIHECKESYIVFDGAVIPENGLLDLFHNNVVLVHCDPEVAITRIMARDNITREQAIARTNSQCTAAYKKEIILQNIRDKNQGVLFEIDSTNGFEDNDIRLLMSKICDL